MVEYGNGISQGAGQAGGSSGGGGGDWGAAVGQAVTDAANTIAAMPPAQLLLIAVLIVAGLFVLKRAL
jgi:hypothetical protein